MSELTKLIDTTYELPETYDEMLAFLSTLGAETIETADVVIDLWPLWDKSKLVNVPFAILGYDFTEGDFVTEQGDKTQYVIVRFITKDGRRGRFADGSTGISKQLAYYEERRTALGKTNRAVLKLENGLSESTYETKDEKGKVIKATTYYLAPAGA